MDGPGRAGDAGPPRAEGTALVGTTGPVTMVHAALTNGGPGGGTPFTVVETGPVPLSPAGDFTIDTQITVPTPLEQPVLLIRIGAAGGPFIAASVPGDND